MNRLFGVAMEKLGPFGGWSCAPRPRRPSPTSLGRAGQQPHTGGPWLGGRCSLLGRSQPAMSPALRAISRWKTYSFKGCQLHPAGGFSSSRVGSSCRSAPLRLHLQAQVLCPGGCVPGRGKSPFHDVGRVARTFAIINQGPGHTVLVHDMA